MKIWITTLGTVLLIAGCQDTSAPPPSSSTGTETKMSSMPMITEGCPDKDATHIVMEDTPVFTTAPGQGVNPVGMIKKGTKVLSMAPGSPYTKCTLSGGKAYYIKTASLKPTTN